MTNEGGQLDNSTCEIALRPKHVPVWKLAKEAGVDVDDVLLAVWDFVHVDGRARDVLDAADNVPSPLVNKIRKSLGIATDRQLRTVAYWSQLLDMSATRLRAMLTKEGFGIGPKQRRLPTGAYRFLAGVARSRRIDPRTGVVGLGASSSPSTDVPQEDIPSPPSFNHIGRHRNLRWLTVDEVLAIHEALVTDFARFRDPIDPPGVRDRNLLESAVFRPQTSLGGILKYPTVETSAAALLCALIHDHPFHNGNKRTALVAVLAFLDENGLVLRCDENELFRFVLLIAKHKITKPRRYHLSDHETHTVAKMMAKWSSIVRKAEHPITFLKLRQILAKYECRIAIKSGRANIERKVPRRRWKLLPSRRLHTQVIYRDEGSDVLKDTIRKIRKDLQLDHEHGLDESDFYYSKKTRPINEFIATYRKTLDRLARL